MRILYVCKENNNNIIYSAILLPELPSSTILESTPERDQRNQRCLRSACTRSLLNVNNTDYTDYTDYTDHADYADYVLGYSPKWWKTVTLGEELAFFHTSVFLASGLALSG